MNPPDKKTDTQKTIAMLAATIVIFFAIAGYSIYGTTTFSDLASDIARHPFVVGAISMAVLYVFFLRKLLRKQTQFTKPLSIDDANELDEIALIRSGGDAIKAPFLD